MKKTLKLGLILLVISVLSAGILAFSNEATKGKIAEIEAQITLDALEGIFGKVDESKDIDSEDMDAILEKNPEVVEVYEIIKSGNSEGYSVTTNSNGFDGPIEIMVGFDNEGNVLGVRLTNHTETAGIGSKTAEPEFTSTFEGESASDEIDVDTISGATVSSTAVIKGVNDAREIYNEFLVN